MRIVAIKAGAIARAYQRTHRITRVLRWANYGEYDGCTFASYRPAVIAKLGHVPQNIEDAIRQIETWPASDFWLYAWGDYSTGKTAMLCAALGEWLAARPELPAEAAHLTRTDDLLTRIQSTFGQKDGDHETTEQVFDALCAVPLLVLDDIGNESGTDWARSQLGQIINRRYVSGHQTAFTSNLHPLQLAVTFTRGVADRILQKAEVVELNGVNLRIGTGVLS